MDVPINDDRPEITCATCSHGEHLPARPEQYRCRRFPPQILPGELGGTWPLVAPTDMCGEWWDGEVPPPMPTVRVFDVDDPDAPSAEETPGA